MRRAEDIINIDFQGWPVYKSSLREIIKSICKYDEEEEIYYIEESNPILDIYPTTLEDDGMGYGVRPQYITEVVINSDDEDNSKNFCHVFIETKNDTSLKNETD